MGSETINGCVTVTLYLLLATGICSTFGESFYIAFERGRMIKRLRARRRDMREEGRFERMLRQALLTASGRSLPPGGFLFLTAALFLSVFFIGSRSASVFTALFTSLTVTSLPYLLLWIRVCSVRRRGSYEGERLVSQFLREYRINNFNVYETIEKVLQSTPDIKVTGRLLSKLLYNLRNTGDPDQIKKATEEFASGIGTNWSLMLAHDIYIAAGRGTNISLAAEDILIQLREARTLSEERKRLNSEAARMAFFLVPMIYCATVLMSVKYLDVPVGKFIQNQFHTAEGLILFLAMLFLFVCNIALIQLVVSKRFDY